MIEFRFNESEIKDIYDRLGQLSLEKRAPAMRRLFVNCVAYLESALKKTVSGEILKVRSGLLRASIQSIVQYLKSEFVGLIGSGVRNGKRVKYANILEEGGTIVPKNKKYLTIPFQAALTSAGVMKYPSARDYPNTFIAGRTIMQRQGSGSIPLFYLARSVTIPAKHYMSITEQRSRGAVMDIAHRTIDQILESK